MRINENCMREVLEYLINNIDLVEENGNMFFKEVSLYTIIEDFKQKYSSKDVWYSVYILWEDRYIDTNNIIENRHMSKARVINVTHKGHDFYESIQSEPIWDKTKSVVGKVGVHTLSFIESVAHDVAVESAKEAVKVAMSPISVK